MPVEYAVKVTKQAQSQLEEIISYISKELKSPENAVNLLSILEAAISSLAHFPNRVALTEEEPWKSKGIHKMPVKNFLVYFWINEKQHRAQVFAVIYSRRDQIGQLSQL